MTSLRGRALAALILALCAAVVQAANPCTLASGGIGGTGAPVALASDDNGDSGIGGTGHAPDQGIGGTGATARSDNGGMGGTGTVADEGGIGGTGIVGVITGFGSICVGGIEVHYGAATPISADGRPLNATQLKIGHVVQVQARGLGESVRAKSIELLIAVSGPVRAVDARGGRLEVLGQQVRASAALVEQASAAAQAGHPVEVSGLRNRDGEIIATRVDAAPGLKEFGVIGPVHSTGAGSARIGNLPIRLDAKQAREVKAGQSMEICGSLENGVLRAHTVENRGVGDLRKQGVERLILEGFVGKRDRDRLQVGDVSIGMDKNTRVMEGGDIKPDQRVVVAARVVDGALVAERVERVRDRNSGHGGTPRGDKPAEGDGGSDEGGSGSGHGDGDGSKSGSGHGGGESDGDRQSGSHGGDAAQDTRNTDSHGGSDARKDAAKASERAQRDAQREQQHESTRPQKAPKPERPPGSSSHGGRADRVRDK